MNILNNYRDQTLFLAGDFNYVEGKQDKQNNLTHYDKIIPKFFDPEHLDLMDPLKRSIQKPNQFYTYIIKN